MKEKGCVCRRGEGAYDATQKLGETKIGTKEKHICVCVCVSMSLCCVWNVCLAKNKSRKKLNKKKKRTPKFETKKGNESVQVNLKEKNKTKQKHHTL